MTSKLKLFLHGAEVNEIELVPGRVYTFGRASTCDVQLEEQPGISRSHFKLSDESGLWMAEVISKFGTLSSGGQRVTSIPLSNGSVFEVAGYDFRYVEIKANELESRDSGENRLVSSTGTSSAALKSAIVPVNSVAQLPMASGDAGQGRQFVGNDEATRIMQSEPEVPYLRVIEPGAAEDLIKLEGRRWFAGREEASSILLNDRKASRRQFELSSTPQGYFVRDLGSANGTLLNGMPLQADELKPIRSGDVIQVGQVTMHFEVRDPQFEKRLMVVPTTYRSDAPIVVHNGYEMINFPILSGPGGAVRVDGDAGRQNKIMALVTGEDLPDEGAKKKRKLMVAITAIVCLFAIFSLVFNDDPPPKKADAHESGFSRLSPNQQQLVKETFVLAKNLYMQKKLALAADQLYKIHQLLPEGYMNSIAMAEDCREAAQQEENLRFIEEQKRKQEETNRLITDTLNRCERLAKSTMDPEALRSCLSPALLAAPDDPRVHEMQQRVERRIAEHDQDVARRHARAVRAAHGKALFQRAQQLEASGQDLDAIEAYTAFIEGSDPDPENLKDVARKNKLALNQRLDSKVDEALKAAEASFASGAFKDALTQIKKAKALAPQNEHAAELNAKFRRELTMKLKDIYEESVISEGIGDVEQAKVKWKKIMEMCLPEDDYYRKAKNKLRSYGAL